MPTRVVVRIVDVYLVEGEVLLHKVTLALLKVEQGEYIVAVEVV